MKNSDIKRLLIAKRGNIAATARALGVTRKTVYSRISKSNPLQVVLHDARETMLDNAETTLYDRALDGGTAELIFFLKTQGKSRGYIERQEQVLSGEVTAITRIVEKRNDTSDTSADD